MSTEFRQVFALTAQERNRLKQLIQEDKEAQACWQAIQQEANSCLSASPRPLRVIHYEGLLHTEPSRIDTTISLRGMDSLVALLYAYQGSGNTAYRDKIREYVLAWVNTYEPTGNPINEQKLEPVLVGCHALKETFSTVEWDLISRWVRRIAQAEIDHAAQKPRSTRNNWHTKRLLIVGLIGLLIEDAHLMDYSVTEYHQYIEACLYPDGSSNDFRQRDALHYQQSGLKPLVVLARIFKHNGIDLWTAESSSEASVQKSIDFMIPFVDGTQVHAEWVNSQSDIDHRRAAAGLAYYQPGKPFDPRDALEVFELASYFEPRYLPLVKRITHSAAERFPTWLTVLSAAR